MELTCGWASLRVGLLSPRSHGAEQVERHHAKALVDRLREHGHAALTGQTRALIRRVETMKLQDPGHSSHWLRNSSKKPTNQRIVTREEQTVNILGLGGVPVCLAAKSEQVPQNES